MFGAGSLRAGPRCPGRRYILYGATNPEDVVAALDLCLAEWEAQQPATRGREERQQRARATAMSDSEERQRRAAAKASKL